MRKILLLSIVSTLAITLAGCAPPTSPPVPAPSPAPVPAPEKVYDIKTDASGTKYIVNPVKIMGGGPPKDGIPSIDNPKFVTVVEANQWIQDNELVITIIHNGIKRVYPLQIMVWHEIVNETIGGDPILITY
jgi:hypothetical protein